MIDTFAILGTSLLALFVGIRAAILDARERSEAREHSISSRTSDKD